MELANYIFSVSPNDSRAQLDFEINGLGRPKKRGQQPRVHT